MAIMVKTTDRAALRPSAQERQAMKNRLLAIAAIAIAIVGTFVLILMLLPQPPGVTKGNFDRLALGMSRDEVETLFGKACDDSHIVEKKTETKVIVVRCHLAWNSDDGQALIHFDQNGQIEKKLWFEAEFTLWQRLQRRFPWLPD